MSRRRARTLTRREFLALAGAGTVGASLLGAGCDLTEHLPSLPNNSPLGNHPNVVLVILDSLRKDHVGAYGNDWIKTPNLDALSKESLRFERAYPESIPTICARRAIHTGLRTWPFRNWTPPPGETFMPAGWQHIPEDQTTLSEVLFNYDFNTVLLSDTEHLFKATMNFQRGFMVYDWIRGQERDRYRPTMTVPEEEVAKRVVPGN